MDATLMLCPTTLRPSPTIYTIVAFTDKFVGDIKIRTLRCKIELRHRCGMCAKVLASGATMSPLREVQKELGVCRLDI